MGELRVETLSPEENMRRDEEALLSFEEDPEPEPRFRLYRWDRVCLSLGHFQKEKPFLRLPTVRRPTGGGALLHGWDLSFSLVDLRKRWGDTPTRIYKKVSELFIRTFFNLGVEVCLERFRGRYLDNFYCFWVPTLGELTCGGRKLVSMAMRTLKRGFLVHGSVYIDFDYGKAQDLLGIPENVLRNRIVSLKELGVEEALFVSSFQETIMYRLHSLRAQKEAKSEEA